MAGLLDRILPWRARAAGRAEARSSAETRLAESRAKLHDHLLRHWEAANADRRRPNWNTFSLSADMESLHVLPILRSRSRLMADCDAKAHGLVHKDVVNVIGPRFGVQAEYPSGAARRDGVSDDEVAALTDRAEEFWRDTVFRQDSRLLDWRAMRTPLQLVRLMYRHRLVDGELFVRWLYKPGRALPFALRIIEAECIGTPPQRQNDRSIRGGIEYAADGERVAAWIAIEHPGDLSGGTSYERVPFVNELGLPQLTHFFEPNRETASRGLPWMTPVLPLINDTSDYKDSELQRKIKEADIAHYITLNDPDMMKEMLEADSDFGADVGGSNGSARKRSEVKSPKNQVYYLEANEGIEVVDPSRPGNMYQPFLDSHDRDIGNGLGRSFERVSNNYGAANFSATRVSGIEDYVEHECDFALFAGCVLSDLWQWSMWALAMLEGDPRYRSLLPTWQRYIKPSWDPESDADAATERLGNGTSDPFTECSMAGRDAEKVIRARLRAEQLERRLREEAGLPLPGEIGASLDDAVDGKIASALKAKDKKTAADAKPAGGNDDA